MAITLTVSLLLLLFAAAAACGGGETPDDNGAPADAGTPAGGEQQPGTTVGAAITLQEGTVARYLVQEQFARLDFPNDAIGETSDVTGMITLSPEGEVISAESRIVLNAASLRSDESRRDDYLSRNAIQTGTYPEIIFAPTAVRGLAWPLPTSGEAGFIIEGDLTVREVTRPVEWETTASFNGAMVTGTAKTNFTFGEFDMEVPDLFFLLSVEDNIRLELDFTAAY